LGTKLGTVRWSAFESFEVLKKANLIWAGNEKIEILADQPHLRRGRALRLASRPIQSRTEQIRCTTDPGIQSQPHPLDHSSHNIGKDTKLKTRV